MRVYKLEAGDVLIVPANKPLTAVEAENDGTGDEAIAYELPEGTDLIACCRLDEHTLEPALEANELSWEGVYDLMCNSSIPVCFDEWDIPEAWIVPSRRALDELIKLADRREGIERAMERVKSADYRRKLAEQRAHVEAMQSEVSSKARAAHRLAKEINTRGKGVFYALAEAQKQNAIWLAGSTYFACEHEARKFAIKHGHTVYEIRDKGNGKLSPVELSTNGGIQAGGA